MGMGWGSIKTEDDMRLLFVYFYPFIRYSVID